MRCWAGCLAGAMCLTVGCQTTVRQGARPGDQAPPPTAAEIDPTRVEARDDIFQIVPYWIEPIWLQRQDRIIGFKATVYFRSAQSNLGAFVSGDIFVWVYELVPAPGGRWERRLAHMWQFNQAQALGFRVRKRSIQGYFYGFLLTWPSTLALEGKRVEIEFGYERADKRVVLSEPRQFRVPVPIGYTPATQEARP